VLYKDFFKRDPSSFKKNIPNAKLIENNPEPEEKIGTIQTENNKESKDPAQLDDKLLFLVNDGSVAEYFFSFLAQKELNSTLLGYFCRVFDNLFTKKFTEVSEESFF